MTIEGFIEKLENGYGISAKLQQAIADDLAEHMDDIDWASSYSNISNTLQKVWSIYDVKQKLIWKRDSGHVSTSAWRSSAEVVRRHLSDPERFVEFVRKYLPSDFNVGLETPDGVVSLNFGDVYIAAKKQPESPEKTAVITFFEEYQKKKKVPTPAERAEIMGKLALKYGANKDEIVGGTYGR